MSDETKTLSFVAFCIERYKTARQLNGEDAAALFHKYGVERYLYEEYDVLHTMGDRALLDDIDRFIEVRKGNEFPLAEGA